MKCEICDEKIDFSKYWSFCFDCRTVTCKDCIDLINIEEESANLCYQEDPYYTNQLCEQCEKPYFYNNEENIERIKVNLKKGGEKKAILHFFYGVFKLNGFGCLPDQSCAFLHFFQSARTNFAPALCALGNLYCEGIGTELNYEIGFQKYLRAAMLGYPEAIYCLGICFMKGNGVMKDVDEGKIYIKLAADRGYVDAFSHIAFIYRQELDFEKADSWYKKFIIASKNELPVPGMSDLFRKQRIE